jgi:hypothetical protein
MARGREVSRKEIEYRYWRNVEIQDDFWRHTFAAFTKPLATLFRDPMSAGAHLLSAYQTDPAAAARDFASQPQSFGELISAAPVARAKRVHRDIQPLLSGCAEKFEAQRIASTEVAKFERDYPRVYWRLQKQRSVRALIEDKTTVRFMGQSIVLDVRPGPRRKR